MKTAKTAIKVIIFVALLLVVLWGLAQVFTYPRANMYKSGDCSRERFNSFYKQDDNIIDCVFLGTSGTDRYWLPSFAWHDNGLATYSLVTPSQPLAFSENLIKETLKTQDVKLFVLDLRMITNDLTKRKSPPTRRVTDNMKYSLNWLNAIIKYRKLMSSSEKKRERFLSFLYKPYKYHSMWNTMELEELEDLYPEDKFFGYYGANFVYKIRPQKPTRFPIEPMDVAKDNKKILKDLYEYCQTIDAEVVFISTPVSNMPRRQGKLKSAAEYAREVGFEVYDFNTEEMYDELNWDFKTDHYNPNHANFKGALKFTDYLSEILINRYGLKDHRNDDDITCYTDWENGYKTTMRRAKKKMPDVYEKRMAGEPIQ